MSTIEFAPKKSVVIGRIATKTDIKAADNSKWDYDAIVMEVRDASGKAHELRFNAIFADNFGFASDLFIGNIICADVEECLENITQYLDENDEPQYHTQDHIRVDAVRSATEDEVVGFLTTVITKNEVATMKEVYASLDIIVEPASWIAAARQSATPLIVSAKESLLAERKGFTEAYNKLHGETRPASTTTKAEVNAKRLAELTSKREALAKSGAAPALLASYDRKIEALQPAEA